MKNVSYKYNSLYLSIALKKLTQPSISPMMYYLKNRCHSARTQRPLPAEQRIKILVFRVSLSISLSTQPLNLPLSI